MKPELCRRITRVVDHIKDPYGVLFKQYPKVETFEDLPGEAQKILLQAEIDKKNFEAAIASGN
jgi:hypothetical protein